MAQSGASTMTISDFNVSLPLRVKAGVAQPVRLLTRKEGEGYRFSARTLMDGTGTWLECASGEVVASVVAPQPPRFDIDAIRRKCGARILGLEGPPRNEAQSRHIAFGSRWGCTKKVWLGRDEALSLLELPAEFATEIETYRLHPALLDMATGSAMFLIKGNEAAGYLYVPVAYGSLMIHGPLPAVCYAYVKSKSGAAIESPIATFDVYVLDPEGNVIVEVRDFSVRQIHDVSLLEDRPSSGS